jgi:hypothetical protein
VFIDRDYGYGYFINEHVLFTRLTAEQQRQYLEAKDSVQFDVSPIQAQAIRDRSFSPFK